MTDASTATTSSTLDGLFTEHGSTLRFTAGQTIIRQGDLSDHVLALRTGAAKVVLRGEDDAEIVLALREPPEIIGEQAALTGGPRFSSVVALTDVTALAVPAAALRDLVEADTDAALAIYRIVAGRHRDSERARVELASRTVAQRAAAQLLALAPRIGAVDETTGAVRLPLTQQDLAGWVGASREAIVRTLRQMRDDGIVTTERATIIIHDLEALRVKAPT
ncbi:Crp/Fnr family transcriptional regulator [Kitasatospora sp. NBC_01302]|uniref:Crp/Fnr family transcriptional regulator n=1 Tax=Kitasatospora sp. NBC_01302 TaxID=2903575 RepID=UPI002E0EEA2A|nr:Crp/Fnr family transcriptional regulator [Kitasatospora sp. NBC_01302]